MDDNQDYCNVLRKVNNKPKSMQIELAEEAASRRYPDHRKRADRERRRGHGHLAREISELPDFA